MENLKHLIFIFISYQVVNFSYGILNKILQKNNDYLLLQEDRKLYIIKNTIKSITLMCITIINYKTIVNILFNDIFYKDSIIYLGIIYGINDTYGLINVPNLPFSTKVHHSITTLLYLSTLFYNYDDLGYLKGIVVYAVFSILSGSVNGYLSYRFLYPKSIYRFYFKRFAFYNYLICFILEWIYQYKIFLEYYFDSRSFGLIYRTGFIIYLICIHMIMYDDIKLIQFLRKDARVRIVD